MYPDPSQLRDIHVVLGNPWWPPAPGWWLLLLTLLGVALLLRGLGGRARWRLAIPLFTLGDWRGDAARALAALRRAGPRLSLKEQAAALSELLRRIAMARHGRAACAGLSGPAWLDWLAAHDPNGFDWPRHGRLLIAVPYAPARSDDGDRADLGRLLAATEAWIDRPAPHQPRQQVQPGHRRRWWWSTREAAGGPS